MKLFKYFKRKNGRKALGAFAILVGLALVAVVVRFIGNGFSSTPKAERLALEAFDAWVEDNVIADVAGRSLENTRWISDYGTYVDTNYVVFLRRIDVLEDAMRYLDMGAPERRSAVAFQESIIKSMESLDSLRNKASLVREKEKLDLYRALDDGTRENGNLAASLYMELSALRDSVKAIEKTPGVMRSYLLTLRDSSEYRVMFLSPEDDEYRLVLMSVRAMDTVDLDSVDFGSIFRFIE